MSVKNKISSLLICLGITSVFLSSVIPVKGADVWYSQFMMMSSLGFIGASLVLWKFNKYISVFTVYCLFSMMIVTRTHPSSFIVLTHIYFACLIMRFISNLDSKKRKWILWTMVAVAVMQGIYIILQYAGFDFIFHEIPGQPFNRTVGFAGSRNQIGVFFAVTAPLVVSMLPWAIPLIIFGLCCSVTTTAWIAAIISCMVFLLMRCKKVTLYVIPIILILSVVFFWKFDRLSNEAVTERLDLVKLTISQIHKGKAELRYKNVTRYVTCNPWTGFGLNTFMRVSPYSQFDILWLYKLGFRSKSLRVYSHAHNDYAEAWFEFGHIGFSLVLIIILNLFYRFFRAKKTKELTTIFCCLLAHMGCAMGVFSVHTAHSGMLLVVFMGLFEGYIKEA